MMLLRLAMAGTLLVMGAAHAEPRLLTLGGAVTETVFALGQERTLVATDQTSLFPKAAAAVPKLGYLRALGAEGLLSLHPDIVLASADAGPPSVMTQIQAAGAQLVSLPEAHSEDAAISRIRLIGEALSQQPRAEALIERMQADLARLHTAIASAPHHPRVLFLLSAGKGAPMAAGATTAADAMIQLAGGVNVVAGLNGYRALSAEAIIPLAPDVIVTTTDTLRGNGGIAGLLAQPGLSATPAGQAGRVVDFDALYLLGFGPRLPQALRDLALALHPDMDPVTLSDVSAPSANLK